MIDFAVPKTLYALSGDVNIAYQTIGSGPVDIVVVPGIMSHVEFLHELPGYSAFLRRLSTFARVVTFDKRGQGL
ncbi:MAG TPA: adenylate/guanylate cyclase domain-containing protein, partial [Bradyrhizobium sp.]